MVAVSDRLLLEQLAAKVERLTRLVRRQAIVIDAMREAWLLPPVGVLRAERREARQAEGTTFPDQPRQPLSEDAPRSRGGQAAARTLRTRAADLGRQAAMRGVPADDCPYKPGAWIQRKAWLQAHAEERAKATSTKSEDHA